MEAIIKILNHRIAYHIYLWGAFILLFFFAVGGVENFSYGCRFSLSFIVPWIFAVYLHFYVRKLFFVRRKYVLYVLSLVLIIMIFGYLSELSVNKIMYEKIFDRHGYIDVTLMIVISTALRFFKRDTSQQIIIQETKAKQLNAELQLFRNQVNPHFLFNTLNNLFSVALKNNDNETAEGISKLSHLMRYMLHDSNVEKISLEKEIKYIEDFMELQKIRFSSSYNIKIDFNKSGNINTTFISPMILIPFVENAFKHGISIENESFVNINLEVNQRKIIFSVENTINKLREENNKSDSGIGLENVKRRLELIYPKKHSLKIKNDGNLFFVYLEVNL